MHPELTRYSPRYLSNLLVGSSTFFLLFLTGIFGGNEEEDLIPREEFERGVQGHTL
jgi:hypothetical protein